MSGLIQGPDGINSTGRVLLLAAAGAGIALLAVGVILLFKKFDGAELCIMTGSGMVLAAVAGKNWQKTVEK